MDVGTSRRTTAIVGMSTGTGQARLRMGTGGALLFLVIVGVSVALLPDQGLWMLLPAVVIWGELSGRDGLRTLAHPRFWGPLVLLVALSPFLLGTPDTHRGAFSISRAGFEAGVTMALRAAVLTLALRVSIGALTVAQLTRLFERAGGRGLGFALGVALNLLPVFQDVIGAAYHTVRLRGGFRRPLRGVWLFLLTVVVNGLRYGDDVVKAAQARAFDPTGPAAPGTTHLTSASHLT